MNQEVVALHRFIVDFFSLGELEALCFGLFVDHENFESRDKEAKAREFVLHMQRNGRLDDLHGALARERPAFYGQRFGRTEFPVSQSPNLQSPISHDPQQIFISHAHENAEFARRLAADLRADGWAVWIAPESIRPVEDWVDAINRGLEGSGVFVLVLTPAAVASRWVKTETNLAVRLQIAGNLHFIPLEVKESRPPLIWTGYQYILFRDGYMAGLSVLRRRLGGQPKPRSRPSLKIAQPPKPQPKAVPPKAAPEFERIVHKKSGIELVRIPAGDFLYGDKKRKVYLPEYWIGRAPVTNEQYARFVTDTGYKAPHRWWGKRPPAKLGNHPVVNVSWNDAQAYCEWAELRLPAEEEWEKAARGRDGREYPWGNEPPNDRLCNFNRNVKTTTPVGRYSPQGDSPYGCVDMAGNVWEWTDSWYDKNKAWHVLRGGSFYNEASVLRGTSRSGNNPFAGNDNGVFGCVRPHFSPLTSDPSDL